MAFSPRRFPLNSPVSSLGGFVVERVDGEELLGRRLSGALHPDTDGAGALLPTTPNHGGSASQCGGGMAGV